MPFCLLLSWIFRHDLDYLADTQIQRWIEKQEGSLAISSDGSTTKKEGLSILAVGLVNADNEFISLKTTLVAEKDAKNTASNIMGVLPTSCLSKINASIGDSAHVQQLTTKLVHKALQEINNDQKTRSSFICGLHTKASCSRNTEAKMSDEYKQLYRDIQIAFSQRLNKGHRTESLAVMLEDELIEFNQKISGVRFVSNLGSRAGSIGNNAFAFLVYRSEVKSVINERIQQLEEKNKDDGKLERLRRIVSFLDEENLDTTMVHMGSHLMLWYGVSQRISKLENNKLTITEKKAVIAKCEERYQKLLSETDPGEPYERLLAISADASLSQTQRNVINECGRAYLNASLELKKEVNDYIYNASDSALLKLKKDTKAYMDLADSDEYVISTNQMAESVFAVYKHYELQFPSMSNDVIETLTRCARNKVEAFSLEAFYNPNFRPVNGLKN